MDAKTEARFWAKVSPPTDTGCLLWLGARLKGPNTLPYGVFWYNNRQGRAHRYAWERIYGVIPHNLEIDHFVCDSPPCVNSEHFRLVTSRDNILRSNCVSAINARKTHCSKKGHPLFGDNLYIAPGGNRHCRACKRDEQRKRLGIPETTWRI